MFRKFKEIKFLLSFLLIITWVFVLAGGYFYYSMNQKELAIKNDKITELNNNLTQIGELVTAFTLNANVKAGKKIEETDFTMVQVPISMANNLVMDATEFKDKYYRLDLSQGTALSKDAIFKDELTDDTRLFDVVLHNTPIGLKEGAFVDVRISLPLGEDFISMSHKKVYAINGGVMKLAVTEQDIHSYNSMLIDSLLYPGTNLYAVEYLEGGVQKEADNFYPVSKNILSIAQKDPNLLSAIKSDILVRRDALEKGLAKVEKSESQDTMDTVLQNGREKYQESISEAEREHEIKAERQAEADASAAANAAAGAE